MLMMSGPHPQTPQEGTIPALTREMVYPEHREQELDYSIGLLSEGQNTALYLWYCLLSGKAIWKIKDILINGAGPTPTLRHF